MSRRFNFGRFKRISFILAPRLWGGNSWTGSVLAPNGKIYGIPANATSILVINPQNNTASTFGSLTGNNKWAGGVLAPNGKIYCAPLTSPDILVIDTNNDTTSSITPPLTGSYAGGVLASNGKIYLIPSYASSVLVINPNDNTTYQFGSLVTSLKFAAGVLASNGKIYCVPASSSGTTMVIDTVTDSISFISLPIARFANAILGFDNNIYCGGANATKIVAYNPITNTSTTFGDNLGGLRYLFGTLAADGNIYYAPYSVNNILQVSPIANETRLIGNIQNFVANKWSTGVLGLNGKIYFMPNWDSRILVLDTLIPPNPSDCVIPSNLSDLPDSNYNRYYNKL